MYCLRGYNFTTKEDFELEEIPWGFTREELVYFLKYRSFKDSKYNIERETWYLETKDGRFKRHNYKEIVPDSTYHGTDYPNYDLHRYRNQQMWCTKIFIKEKNRYIPIDETKILEEVKYYQEPQKEKKERYSWSERHSFLELNHNYSRYGYRHTQYKKYGETEKEIYQEFPELKKYRIRDKKLYRKSNVWNDKPVQPKTIRDKNKLKHQWERKLHKDTFKEKKIECKRIFPFNDPVCVSKNDDDYYIEVRIFPNKRHYEVKEVS